jgi:hypothetical protein
MSAEGDLFSSRDVADRWGVPLHRAVKVIDRLGLGRRIGRNRAVRVEDLDKIELGLRAAGYLTPREDARA